MQNNSSKLFFFDMFPRSYFHTLTLLIATVAEKSFKVSLKNLPWRLVAQYFSGSVVKSVLDLHKLSIADFIEISCLWKEPSDQAVCILISSSFPRRIGISKIDLSSGHAR